MPLFSFLSSVSILIALGRSGCMYLGTQKNALDRKILSVKDEYGTNQCHTIRGATLNSWNDPCAYQDTNISPATDVCPHVAEYFAIIAFDCTLSGPFDNLFLT